MADHIKYNDYRSGYSFKKRAAPGYKRSTVKYSRGNSRENNSVTDFNEKGGRSDNDGIYQKHDRCYVDNSHSRYYEDSDNYRSGYGERYSHAYGRSNEGNHNRGYGFNHDRNKDRIKDGNKDRDKSSYSLTDSTHKKNHSSSSGYHHENDGDEKDSPNHNNAKTYSSENRRNDKTEKGDSSKITNDQDNGYNEIKDQESDIRFGDMEHTEKDILERKYLFDDEDLGSSGGDIKYHTAKKVIKYAKRTGSQLKEKIEENSGEYGYETEMNRMIKTAKGLTTVASTFAANLAAFMAAAAAPVFLPLIVGILIVVIVSSMFFSVLSNKAYGRSGGGFSAEVEAWRSVVQDRCDYYKDTYEDFDTTNFVNAILATIDQESNGISKSCGGDLMQSRESGYWTSGTPSDWDKFSTEKKSIDAGCRYFFSAVDAWGVTDAGDYDGLQIVAQGYNMGTAYLSWMKAKGETVWTETMAEAYSAKMKSQLGVSAYGNPKYGEQWLEKYRKAKTGAAYSGDFANLEGTYIFQQGSGPCCACGIADMIYRYVYLCGDTEWDSFNPDMTTDDGTYLYDLIVGGGELTASWGRFDSAGNVFCETRTGWEVKDYFSGTIHGISFTVKDSGWTGFASDDDARAYLEQHPEGVAVYNGLHCTVLTRYDEESDTFYCIDPGQWGSSSVGNPETDACARKEMPLSETCGHAVKSISEIKGYWYIGDEAASPGDS